MKAHHCLVVGDSGKGKTTFLREMHATASCASVWVNHSNESRVAGEVAATAPTMKKACASFSSFEQVRINMKTDKNPREAFAVAREFALELHSKTGAACQIIIDEAHAALPDSESKSGADSGNPVRTSLHEDRDKGIKVVLATQDPQDLYYPPIKQCRHIVWVGDANSLHKGFINYYNLSDIQGGSLPSQEFDYVVIKPTLPAKIVYSGRTKEKYA